MSEQPPDPEQPPELSIALPEAQVAGVYANFAAVAHTAYEFTVDFARLDFNQQPPAGIVVARVSLSPLLVAQLIDALNTNWARYIERAMPPEVTGHGRGEGGQADEDGNPSA